MVSGGMQPLEPSLFRSSPTRRHASHFLEIDEFEVPQRWSQGLEAGLDLFSPRATPGQPVEALHCHVLEDGTGYGNVHSTRVTEILVYIVAHNQSALGTQGPHEIHTIGAGTTRHGYFDTFQPGSCPTLHHFYSHLKQIREVLYGPPES